LKLGVHSLENGARERYEFDFKFGRRQLLAVTINCRSNDCEYGTSINIIGSASSSAFFTRTVDVPD
jgi:hypothetical protein